MSDSSKKYDASSFKRLFYKKLTEQEGSLNEFIRAHGLVRTTLMKALAGTLKPGDENVNLWCRVLNCTEAERTDFFHSVGRLTPEEYAAYVGVA